MGHASVERRLARRRIADGARADDALSYGSGLSLDAAWLRDLTPVAGRGSRMLSAVDDVRAGAGDARRVGRSQFNGRFSQGRR